MWRVLLVLTVLATNCDAYSKPHKPMVARNQRIIKVHGPPPHHNHYHGHVKKVIRGIRTHGRDEFIRPNLPPPIPPFFNGPSTNHVKHLPRPPPHVFHKAPSYGHGFPYKSYSWSNFNSFTSGRPSGGKDHFRAVALHPSRPSGIATSVASSGGISSGISTTFHSPTFTSTSNFVSSPPVGHIISSDDNNGPIREIPAPNLGPKPHHDDSFDAVAHIQSDTGDDSFDGVSHLQTDSVTSFDGVAHVPSSVGNSFDSSAHLQSGTGGQYLSSFGKDSASSLDDQFSSYGKDSSSSLGGQYLSTYGKDTTSSIGDQYLSTYGKDTSSSIGGQFVSSYGKDSTSNIGGQYISSFGKDTAPSNPYVSTFGKDTVVNLDAIVKDPGLENTIVKESSGDLVFGKQPSVEIANFDDGSSLDVTNLIKDTPVASHHHHSSGYEVTESHNHLPSNDQIIKGHDGTKLYYAPDPDPSLPVHKVPPTNDPHSTPSNGQNLNNLYLPQYPQAFPPYVPGGSVNSLSSQELFHLMNGYPAVISQPIVAFVGQPQSQGMLIQGGVQNHFQQGSNGHYSQQGSYGQNGNDLAQYLSHPDIHDLIHNSHDSHHYEQQALGASHSSVVSQDNYPQQSTYSPQNQYKNVNSNSDSTSYSTSEVSHNFQYEPEASESNIKNSLTVIRQTKEGTLTSETVKNLLLEDSATNELKETPTTILQLKNIPEVPFYASLPNQKAAEALASLQAAGSVASNYMNRIKTTKDDQGKEESSRSRRRNLNSDGPNLNLLKNHKNDDSIVQGETIQLGREKTIVDIQKSLPLYETSISAKNLVETDNDSDEEEGINEEVDNDNTDDNKDDNNNNDDLDSLDFKDYLSNETFGKRIRPK